MFPSFIIRSSNLNKSRISLTLELALIFAGGNSTLNCLLKFIENAVP